MKRLFILVIISLPLFAFAQDKMTITDTFDGGRFQWDEAYEKDYTICLMDGYYLLENKNDAFYILGTTDLPVEIDRNFKIKVKINVTKFKKEKYWGIVFDYQDSDNFTAFLVAEKKFKIVNKTDGVYRLVRQGAIILSAKKNKDVFFEMEKKSKKLTFTVDDMEVITITRQLSNSNFGFIVEGENTIKVDEISIEQRVD